MAMAIALAHGALRYMPRDQTITDQDSSRLLKSLHKKRHWNFQFVVQVEQPPISCTLTVASSAVCFKADKFVIWRFAKMNFAPKVDI
jgi:hypothetical protein